MEATAEVKVGDPYVHFISGPNTERCKDGALNSETRCRFGTLAYDARTNTWYHSNATRCTNPTKFLYIYTTPMGMDDDEKYREFLKSREIWTDEEIEERVKATYHIYTALCEEHEHVHAELNSPNLEFTKKIVERGARYLFEDNTFTFV